MMKRDGLVEEKIISIFKSNKHVTEVLTYGSLSDDNSDSYSDIDLIVKTDNPQQLINELPGILSQIDDYFIILPIQETVEESVYTVMWKNIPFYQKLDLKIIFNRGVDKPVNFPFDENFRYFYDYMIGLTRMVKYCKRDMFWSAYKFYKASFEMLLKLKLESLDGEPRLSVSLQDFISLDKANVDFSNYLSFAVKKNKMLEITNDFLELSLKMKKITKVSNEYDFAQKVIKFTANELGVKSGYSKKDTLPDKRC